MPRYTDAEWERIKLDLFSRSMIASPPALSRAPEETPEVSPPAEIEDQAAESSLPDLIVERARKRHHDDESDEYYEKFEKKIKRFYNKHFLEQEVNDDTDASSIDVSWVGNAITKFYSVENTNISNSPVVQDSDERARSLASSTPTEEFECFVTIADVHMVPEQGL